MSTPLSSLSPKHRAESEAQLNRPALVMGHAAFEPHSAGLIAPARSVVKSRIRQKQSHGMNKLEAAFLAHLKTETPELVKIRFNAVRFELANGLHFKPGFTVGIRDAYEVKGPWASRDAFPRLKMAARLYPEILWRLATRKKGGSWDVLLILP